MSVSEEREEEVWVHCVGDSEHEEEEVELESGMRECVYVWREERRGPERAREGPVGRRGRVSVEELFSVLFCSVVRLLLHIIFAVIHFYSGMLTG